DQEDPEDPAIGRGAKERLIRDALYHGRPYSIEACLRRLRINLGHAPVSTMMWHLRSASATKDALEMVAEFRCDAYDAKMDPKPTVKALNILCDTSSLQSMTPFDEDDEEVAVDLLRLHRDNWTRPCMRPKRLRLDPAKHHVSQNFSSPMERDGTTSLSSAGGAEDQNGRVQRHGPWFAQMLRAAVAEMLLYSLGIVASSSVLSDPAAVFAARVGAMAWRQVLSYHDKQATRLALDARPRRHVPYKPGDMEAAWRKVTKGGG
ncbi:unnamed protein product, partial [Prorocentrum cordatum]